jgi:hypothetical protein
MSWDGRFVSFCIVLYRRGGSDRQARRFETMPVTTITESSKHHRSVNLPTLQPRPIIGGERHGA